MSKKINETLLDKRTVDKIIAKGLVSKSDYEDYIKSLPDESKNSEALKVFSEEDNILTFASVEQVK
ncbi:MAG: hypothetical protein HYU98_00960 [Deltaproteobacteria bacterium]|nr:hypothetical protein [Deltaproteobacteria bacterium]